ncbi:CopD family protein [Acrocarpospora sp. B8E8]|uniref:CopD family protein n=1 Tax=Acrocarpospora sp. B8E8 TaxID=3153572 RepID=UPI00325D8F47
MRPGRFAAPPADGGAGGGGAFLAAGHRRAWRADRDGGYTSWRALGSLAALPGSSYGTLLLFKLAALGLLLWLGMWSRSAVRRRSTVRHQYAIPAGVGRRTRLSPGPAQEELVTRTQLRRSIRIELILGALILALTSALTATARPSAVPAPPAASQIR